MRFRGKGIKVWCTLSPSLAVSLCHVDLDLPHLCQQCGCKSFSETFGEGCLSLGPYCVGPDQDCARLAKMAHGGEQLIQKVMLVNHVCRQHNIVAISCTWEGPEQVIFPGQSFHLWCVLAEASRVVRQVAGQVVEDDCFVCRSHPGPCWQNPF